ncbi:MAG: methyltransferase domain-containing protein [Solirubrobacteraceae bacterium]
MSQLAFDEDLGRQLEVMYRTRDVLRRRQLVRDALAARPGERILDVGCGPGFYAAELLEQVGPEGSVTGVDASAQMLAVAARRCEALGNVSFHQGDATALPVADASADGAICVQVLEYVQDVPAALGELRRALRPGGRLVVWDVDWATLSIHSTDPERSQRVLEAWDAHLAHPSLPRTLAPLLRAAGFEDVRVEGHAFATAEHVPDAYGGSVVPLIEQYVGGSEAAAWGDELRALGERGEFYFACIQLCFTATRGA